MPHPQPKRARAALLCPTLLAVAFIGATQTTRAETGAQLDLDGDGMSDVWQAMFSANGIPASGDADGDGLTNGEESTAGTDPFSATSRPGLDSVQVKPADAELVVGWQAVAGKRYSFETSTDLVTWTPAGAPVDDAAGASTLVLALSSPSPPRLFCRFAVSDRDLDRDGLNAYEENLLGSSDSDTHSGDPAAGSDFAAALTLFDSPGTFSVGGNTVAGTPPTLAESSRFLQQATMGADFETIQAVSASGYPAWIDAQMALPATSHVVRNNALSVTLTEEGTGETFPFSDYVWTWWDVNITAPDILRQRVAFALSEIFVIGQTTDVLEDYNWGVATYYDILVNGAFGNFRDILYNVSTSPAMGHYLSHARNRPTDPANNIFPDENYAREVMQLFSIGLFELNLDGSRKKDGGGNDIPTYDNSDITEFARVFTGLTYNPQNPNNGTPWENDDPGPISNIIDYLEADPAWMGIEMAQYEPMHETGLKNLLYGGTTDGTLQQDLDAAVDNLFNHPNVGPFIGRLLIQRLVKSNPSPAYIARVATAFADNGGGVRGDMKAVVRAILLDPEARNGSFLNDPQHGKLREPVIRHLNLVRAFNVSSSDGTFRNTQEDASFAYGQRPMRSPSVFNFYLPGHQPLGPIKDAGLVAPEFQITTATTTIKTLNYWSYAVPWDELFTPTEEVAAPPEFSMDYSDEIALAGNPDALLDRLDILLTRGQMTPAASTIIRDALVSANAAGTEAEDLVRFAVSLIVSSPDYAVLR